LRPESCVASRGKRDETRMRKPGVCKRMRKRKREAYTGKGYYAKTTLLLLV
jgi:transposase InsO family protein